MGNILITVSLAPVIALIALFYCIDRYEPEPKQIVLKVFGFGVLMVLPAAVIELMYQHVVPHGFTTGSLAIIFVNIFFFIALVEEVCKFIVVMAGIYRSPEFDEPYDGIVYCVAASLGFAALENVLYVFSKGIGTGILRALMAVPAHALFGVLMGYFIGRAKFAPSFQRPLLIALGLFTATAAHAIYDFCLLSRNVYLLLSVFPFLLLLWGVVILMARKAAHDSPFKFNPQKENTPPGQGYHCPACHYSMPECSAFCMHCGISLPHEEKPLEPMSPCPACGFSMPLDARFCRHCGHKLTVLEPVPEKILVCPACNSVIPENSRFCRHCGHAIRPVEVAGSSEEERPGGQGVAPPQGFEGSGGQGEDKKG
jgi:protease PrsW